MNGLQFLHGGRILSITVRREVEDPRLIQPVTEGEAREKTAPAYDYSAAFAAADRAVAEFLTPEPVESKPPALLLADLEPMAASILKSPISE